MSIQLQANSLEFALSQLRAKGTNDLLPRSPWVDCLAANWTYVKDRLQRADLGSHVPSSPILVFAPKSRKGFRITHDLDPVDFLLLSAATHEIAPQIESARDPKSAQRVFSYRVSINVGTLFTESGWDEFQAQSLNLASDPDTTHVLCLDIVDFYNQLSTHRVENALEEAGVSVPMAKAIEEVLLRLNMRASRGIPVGQEFSTLLAEAALGLIDSWLVGRGIRYVRYVDDFRIFCKSWNELVTTLHDVTALLNQDTLKLCLNNEKTRILKASTFIASESVNPEQRAASDQFKKYKQIVGDEIDLLNQNFSRLYHAQIADESDLPKATRIRALTAARRKAVQELFHEATRDRDPDYSMIRYLLISCTKQRSNVILGRVIERIDRLTPVFSFAVAYLDALHLSLSKDQQAVLQGWMQSSARANLAYCREWLAWLLMKRPTVLPAGIAAKLLADWHSDDVAYLFQSCILGNDRSAVRNHKQSWKALGPRQRHWFVRASEILPHPERAAFWKEVNSTDDMIDRSIVAWMSSKG